MSSEKDSNKNYPNKKTKTKKQNSKLSNTNLNSQNIDTKEDFNLLNRKKKREENESNIKNDKIEINQNMFNQYNIYQGLIIPQIGMPMEQINNKDKNFPEVYHKIYYINNPYGYLPTFPNELEIKSCFQETKIENNTENNTNLQDTINNIFKRGIVNHIIGAYFIEEFKDEKKDDEEINNNNNKINKISKKVEPNLSIINKDNINEYNKENSNINDNKKKVIEPNYYNENNSNNKNRLIKPILIW